MSRSRPLILLAVLATLVAALPAQGRLDDVKIEIIPVAPGITMLIGAGGNIGVLSGPDGLVMIDDQFAELSDRIREALAKLEGGDLRFVINTHHHGDHTGGNANFGRQAAIIAHANVRKRLAEPEGEGEAPPPAALPVVTFTDSIQLSLNGQTLDVIHLANGHTDGDSAIFFCEADVVHMGDLFFSGRFPYIDRAHGGSLKGLLAATEQVLAGTGPKTRIIPGHGPLSTRKDLVAYGDMIRKTRQHVAERREAGLTLTEVQDEGLPEAWASWSWQFIDTKKWIAQLWQALEEERR